MNYEKSLKDSVEAIVKCWVQIVQIDLIANPLRFFKCCIQFSSQLVVFFVDYAAFVDCLLWSRNKNFTKIGKIDLIFFRASVSYPCSSTNIHS